MGAKNPFAGEKTSPKTCSAMRSKARRLLQNPLAQLAILLVIAYSASQGLWWALQAAMGSEYPWGYVPSQSMYPTLQAGDLVLIQGVDPRELRVGDIIVYKSSLSPSGFVSHRVIEIREENGKLVFVTKGDNNPEPDPYPVSQDDVVGRVVGPLFDNRYGIPLVGYLFQYNTILIPVIIVLVAIFLWKE